MIRDQCTQITVIVITAHTSHFQKLHSPKAELQTYFGAVNFSNLPFFILGSISTHVPPPQMLHALPFPSLIMSYFSSTE